MALLARIVRYLIERIRSIRIEVMSTEEFERRKSELQKPKQ